MRAAVPLASLQRELYSMKHTKNAVILLTQLAVTPGPILAKYLISFIVVYKAAPQRRRARVSFAMMLVVEPAKTTAPRRRSRFRAVVRGDWRDRGGRVPGAAAIGGAAAAAYPPRRSLRTELLTSLWAKLFTKSNAPPPTEA